MRASSETTGLDFKALEVGSEAWLNVPIVIATLESGVHTVFARVRNCLSEVHNAAQQNDGGPDVAPLLRARARSQVIGDNMLKVVKKKMSKPTQSGAQKRKLHAESGPQPKIIYVEDPPSDDRHSHNDAEAPVISPKCSPPAKRVRHDEVVYQRAEFRPQQVRDARGTSQRPLGAPEDSGSEVPRERNPGMSQHPCWASNDSGSEQPRIPRGTLQRPGPPEDAGADAGSSRLRDLIPQRQDANGDINMYNEEEYDSFMEDYAARFGPPFTMENQRERPPSQFASNQYHGHHQRQFAPSGFGGRGRGVRPQYRGYARLYEFNGYYGRGNEGLIGYGPRRLGCGHSENGDEEQFSDGNVLHRRYPSEDRGY